MDEEAGQPDIASLKEALTVMTQRCETLEEDLNYLRAMSCLGLICLVYCGAKIRYPEAWCE